MATQQQESAINTNYYSNSSNESMHWPNHWSNDLCGAHGYDYDDYDDYNAYDECDFDPQTKKLTIITYSAEKKIKHKTDPFVETHRHTMKIVNRINHRNHWHLYKQERKRRPLVGIIVIDGKELFLGTICEIFKKEIFSKSNRFRSGKHNKGGQSAQRFGRIYDNKINHFVKECATQINKLFGHESNLHFDAIIVAGNGNMKNKLIQSKTLNINVTKTVNVEASGRIGFEQVLKKMEHGEILSDIGSNNDGGIIQRVLTMAEDENECQLLSIGVEETITAIKAKIIEYVVLANGVFKYVIKKRGKAIKWFKQENKLHEYIRNMKINFNGKNRVYKIVGYMDFMMNLCKRNKVELKEVMIGGEISEKFINDYSGCIGVLYQSLEYHKDIK